MSVKFGNGTLLLILAFKTVRTSTAWLAAYMANKMHQEKYIDLVYMKKEEAPPLTAMLLTYLMFHVVISIIMLAAIMAISYLLSDDKKMLWSRFTLMALDFGIELLMTMFMGIIVADVISRKKYFAYKFEGLRAARAFREILFATTAIHALTPYFLTTPVEWRV
jgi:hypothetical protein